MGEILAFCVSNFFILVCGLVFYAAIFSIPILIVVLLVMKIRRDKHRYGDCSNCPYRDNNFYH